MKAINRYIIVDKIKTEPKKVADLIMTDDTDAVSYTHLTLPTNREV